MHFVMQPAEPGSQILADLGVQRTERFVEQQHLRVDRQRACQRHALALAAGELAGVPAVKTAEPHHLKQVVDLLGDLGLGSPADLQTEGDVVTDGQVLEGRVMLEHEADIAPLWRQPGDVTSVYRDGSRVRLIESGDGAQQSRLARTAGSQQRRQRAGGHVEVDIVQCDEVAVAFVGAPHDDRVSHMYKPPCQACLMARLRRASRITWTITTTTETAIKSVERA